MTRLHESQLYTFIDQEKKFALYFLEGQKLVHDLVLTQNLRPEEFEYFRSMVLSLQLMLGYLKTGELFCVYIDSESPYLRLKMEMNAMGLMRGMIYSDGLDAAPEAVTGKLRLLKFLPSTKMPYESIIELNHVGVDEIINLVLSRSYQVNSRVFISRESDQSFMLNQLPLLQKEETADLDQAFDYYAAPLRDIMKMALTDRDAIVAAMDKLGFRFLSAKPVEFNCGCSREQMIENIRQVAKTAGEDVFPPGQDTIEVVCEYCKTACLISRQDIEGPPSQH